ncbi:mannose-binding protein [Streptomyces sp. NPDC005474]|uniref:mannose-binding protein n=1 Tax=Streptomyces sp. NPDC005474 TaxID=3154878 RepID=UPI003455416E
MGARKEGDGTAPGTANGLPRVRVAVALSASAEAPEGALTPGGRPTTPEQRTTSTIPEQRTTTSAAPESSTAITPSAAPEPTPAPATAAQPEAKAKAEAEATASSAAATGTQSQDPEGAMPAAMAAAAAGGTPPESDTHTAHAGRPKKPMLAGAAIVGAVLIAVPFLLMSGGKDDGKKSETVQSVSQQDASDTVLGADTPSETPGDYSTEHPSAPASPKESKPSAPPHSPAAVPPKPQAKPSPSAKKPSTVSHSKPRSASKPKTPKKANPPKAPVWTQTSVTATSTLAVGESWTTNRIRLTQQEDGNLVVYNEHNKPLWASMMFGKNHRTVFQDDGNLVVYNGDNRPVWASQTYTHPGAKLLLRPDGKVVIVDKGTVVWST